MDYYHYSGYIAICSRSYMIMDYIQMITELIVDLLNIIM